jgi:hypothetical protein
MRGTAEAGWCQRIRFWRDQHALRHRRVSPTSIGLWLRSFDNFLSAEVVWWRRGLCRTTADRLIAAGCDAQAAGPADVAEFMDASQCWRRWRLKRSATISRPASSKECSDWRGIGSRVEDRTRMRKRTVFLDRPAASPAAGFPEMLACVRGHHGGRDSVRTVLAGIDAQCRAAAALPLQLARSQHRRRSGKGSLVKAWMPVSVRAGGRLRIVPCRR